jgi:hypothetical protein
MPNQTVHETHPDTDAPWSRLVVALPVGRQVEHLLYRSPYLWDMKSCSLYAVVLPCSRSRFRLDWR